MNTVSRWIKNARPVSLTQSLLPALLAVVLGLGFPGFNVWMALLAVAGVVCVHFAMNLADDYFDYRADMMGARDRVIRKGFRAMTEKYPYLTDGSETPASLMRAIVCMLGVALVCGAGIFVFRLYGNGFGGPHLGIFYSAPPFKFGYRGLGEPVIGIIFGPLLMTGCFYAAAGCVSSEVLWLSAAVGLLVMNILYTHSFIDMAGDEESGKMTLARLLRTVLSAGAVRAAAQPLALRLPARFRAWPDRGSRHAAADSGQHQELGPLQGQGHSLVHAALDSVAQHHRRLLRHTDPGEAADTDILKMILR